MAYFTTSEGRRVKILPMEAIPKTARWHATQSKNSIKRQEEMNLPGAPVLEYASFIDVQTIPIIGIDIKKGLACDRTNPKQHQTNCTIAQAIARNAGLGKQVRAIVGGMWAYIPIVKKVHKYGLCLFIAKMRADGPTEDVIDANDRKRKIEPQQVRFLPLAPSHQLPMRKVYVRNITRKKSARSRGEATFAREETITTKATKAKTEQPRKYRQPRQKRRHMTGCPI